MQCLPTRPLPLRGLTYRSDDWHKRTVPFMRTKKNTAWWNADFEGNIVKIKAFREQFDTMRVPNWVDGELSFTPGLTK